MAESALHRKDWTNTQLFNYMFMTLVTGVFVGFGTFYFQTIIFENGLNEALIWSFLLGTSMSQVFSIEYFSNLSYKLERDNE